VPVSEELKRVLPVVERLAADRGVTVCVDTTKAEVARRAVRAGAAMINDVSALRGDPEMTAAAAETGVPVVLMHRRTEPRDATAGAGDIVSEVVAFLQERVEAAVKDGVSRERLLIDPGFGFGKTVAENLELLRRLGEFRALGLPVVIGTSRKGTIGRVLGGLPVSERVEGTAATVAVAITQGVDIVRVHDVAVMTRVARMTDAIVRGRAPAVTTRVFLGLGSNQGDRLDALSQAETRLAAVPGVRVIGRSSIYETAPVGIANQRRFLNRVLVIETSLPPPALLDAALRIERDLGRIRSERWGPRIIDIDILLYGDETVSSARLTVPHPELAARRFVLVPLLELDPEARLPDGRRLRDLLDALDQSTEGRVQEVTLWKTHL
jgi:dihydropteroate synthase